MSADILPFRPKPRAVEMTRQEMELHYARRINGLVKALEDAGFGPALDRIAVAWRASGEAQAADSAKRDAASIPPVRKRPLIFAVPIFDPPRKRARKPKPSGAPRVLEPA
jgi:hypothetical protein